MPNSLSLPPITYKGEDIQRASPYPMHLAIEEGLDELAEHRGTDRVVPYKDGQVEKARRPHQRTIVLTGWIKGSTAAAYRDLVQELHTIFNPASPGNLVATLEDGGTATIRARAVQIAWRSERIGNTRDLSVVMISIAPNWTIT